MIKRPFLVLAIVLAMCLLGGAPTPISAQGGMTKATAKLLVSDLIEAGMAPTIEQVGSVFVVTVAASPATAATASQVNTFATNRSVTARVLLVRFE